MAVFGPLLDVAGAICALYLLSRVFGRGRPLPPGPRRLPLIGNLLDLPKDYNWVHWAKYKQLYGPISSLSVMGQNFIILNSQQSSIDLLEKRSANYSDRPSPPFANMAGLTHATTLLQYSDVLATHRKHMHRFIGSRDSISILHPIEELETRRFAYRVLRSPDNLLEHVRLFTGSVILKVSHGYAVDTEQPDPLVDLVDRGVSIFSQAFQPGKWLVDSFPILRVLPDWVPGVGFKRLARSWKKCVDEVAERPHQFVKMQMAAGTAAPSFDSFFLEQNPNTEEEFVIKWAAATLYAGGADTSVSAIYSFFIAMQLYPEVQSKAQAELDSVVGMDRLPSFADRPDLPYIEALVKETLRWHAVVPLGIPHIAKENDIYQGYAIPKGSMVLANIWAISHDPEYYHDPYTFKPERFLGVDGHPIEMDPRNVSFGYGRRKCPGKQLADSSVFITIAICLATLNIQKARDEAGNEIQPKYEVTDAVICHPKPFRCSISARSAKAKGLIMSVEEEGVDTRGDGVTISKIALDL